MKKEQTRSLQDEFSSLFRPSQPSPSASSETNLLDSASNFTSAAFKKAIQTQSQEQEQDFLDEVDGILDHGQQQEGQMSRRQIMLTFKLNELRLNCKNFKLANKRLVQRIEELERPRSEITDNTVEVNRSQDLTMMQQEFCEIQEELGRYKQQLASYQQQMASQLKMKNEELARVRAECGELRSVRERLQKELREKNRVIGLLQQRNEELLLAIEQLQTKQDDSFTQSRSNYQQSHFNDRISLEMQEMIDKLMKELKYQRRNSGKNIAEIKRLNGEIVALESAIKERNSRIYELQLAAIKLNKQQYYSNPRRQSPQPQQSHSPRLGSSPQSKTQVSPKIPNKNRISAERQATQSGNNYMLPLGKIYSSFTLMDLLNRQFKIRTVQKYVIASRVVDLYASKLMRGDYSNLISEQIEIYNFSSQNPGQLMVRASALGRNQRNETSEESLLYNMAFILDTLLNQVQVVDAYLGTALELNIPDYIQLVLGRPTRQDKHNLLLQLAVNFEREYLST